MRATMTVQRVTYGEQRAVFEWLHDSTNRGQTYRNVLVISFDVRGDNISGWREYVSEIDPDAVANASVAPR